MLLRTIRTVVRSMALTALHRMSLTNIEGDHAMRKIVVGFVSIILVLLSVSVFAAMPGKEAPPANTLLQFTSGGHVMGFTPNKVYIAGMGHALTEEFINSNIVTPKPLSSDKIIYENLWKGINLTYEARKAGIAESIYTVHPGADVAQIRITYNAEVTIQKNGTLTFNHPTPQGSYTMSAPIAWQEKEGTKIPVQVAYIKLTDTAIGFTTGPYDKNLPLIIDPVYKWHTFYGSSSYDYGSSITVDINGNIYVTGRCDASWGSPINPHNGGVDIVVLKLNSSGAYQWHTFYGSTGDDIGESIATDISGNVYVAASSQGSWGSPINPHSGGDDIMVLKLNSSGVYQWHTFYGSSSYDYGNGITLDTIGNIYVTGMSDASWGSPLNSHGGNYDIVVLKLNNSGVYQWHTFYGSADDDYGYSIVIDVSGNAYVAGNSRATWGTPLNLHNGSWDIVVLKLNNSGLYQWHTFYGSSSYDYGNSITLDAIGNAYVTGYSEATWGSPLNPHSGYYDIIVLKLNNTGAYQWHTFYGSSNYDVGREIALDGTGNICVTGYSQATWGSPLNPHNGDGYADIVVLKLNSSGTYQWHTFHGSTGDDYGYSITADTSGNVYVTGSSQGSWGSPLKPHSGVNDIIVLKLAEILSPLEGTIGTRLTINGTGFGTKKGKVLINDIAAKIAKDGWQQDRITSTINKPPIPIDVAHPVSVVVNKVSTPIDGTFTLRLPALDDLLITRGAYPDPVHVTGKFFGTKKGKVYLYDPITEKKKNCKVTSWTMNESTGISELTFIVPKTSKSFPVATYQLKISNKVGPATTTPEFELLEPAP